MERPVRRPLRGVPAAVLAAAVLAVAARPAAASSPEPALACAPAPGDAAAAVADLSAEGDAILADGRRLRLAGIDLPRGDPAAPGLPARARGALMAWASGPVAVRALSTEPDRWGRIPALLFRDGAPGAAATLVGAGLARVAPDPAARGCTAELLATEAEARAARRGLWADPRYAVLTPADADGLAAQAGGLALVEGILRVHESRGALFLALGRDRRGFVAVVSRRDRRGFARAGLDPREYAGTPVRLRGDLDARFGPRMRLAGPDGFESLEPGSIAEEPGPPRGDLRRTLPAQ